MMTSETVSQKTAQLALSVALLGSLALDVQGQHLVKDLEPSREAPYGTSPGAANGSNPIPIGTAGNRHVFSATADVRLGHELYATDGTAAGTILLRDIGPASASGVLLPPTNDPDSYRASAGGRAFFVADDSVHGRELWVTDGTPAGTRMVIDLVPGLAGSNPGQLISLGNQVLFLADHASLGRRLWVTDGFPAGTRLLSTSIEPGHAASGNAWMMGSGNRVFFVGREAHTGTELYATDGTPEGTYLVSDIVAGAGGSLPEILSAVRNGILFSAVTAEGRELWFSDGTAASTYMVADLVAGRESSNPYSAVSSPSGTAIVTRSGDRSRLHWYANGVLRPVPKISARTSRMSLVSCGQTVLVVEYEIENTRISALNGPRLELIFQTNNTNPMDISAVPLQGGAMFTIYINRNPSSVGGYFHLLWTDGTAAGTRQLLDGTDLGIRGIGGLFPFGSSAVFTPIVPEFGAELWISDGTVPGTEIIADLNPGKPFGSNPQNFTRYGDDVLFTANTLNGPGLYRTDGTTQGTVTLGIVPGISLTTFEKPVVLGDRILLTTGRPGTSGRQVFRSYGRPGDLQLLDLAAGNLLADPVILGTAGDTFVLALTSPTIGRELVLTDGTLQGTTVVDLQPGSNSSGPRHGGHFQGKFYFTADDGVHGAELWVTDGTVAGTRMLKDLQPGGVSSVPSTIVAAETQLFFGAHTAAHGFELWRSDGTAAGTRMVLDLYPGTGSGIGTGTSSGGTDFTRYATAFGDQLVFPGALVPQNEYLWCISDGTAAGTRLLPMPAGIPSTQSATQMLAVGRSVYWRTYRGASQTLLITDTIQTSSMLTQTGSYDMGSLISLEDLDGAVLFGGRTAASGFELWTSDGTPSGTRQLTDLLGGPVDGFGGSAIRLGNQVLFSGDDGSTGFELYSMPASRLGISAADAFGSTCVLGSVPTLAATRAPRLGQEAVVSMSGALPQAAAVFVIGNKAAFQLGACQLLVTPSVLVPAMTDLNGTALLSVPIPADITLVGATLPIQGAVADPAGVLGALALTRGLSLLVGR